MKVFYEEKTYESYFNNELDNISSIYFPPGQVLEGALGFDSVSFTKDKKLWKKLGYPFRFNPHFLGADLHEIAKFMEIELKFIADHIPPINTNIIFQYKRPVYITNANGNEWKHWSRPYYRYSIEKQQQRLLEKIDKGFKSNVLTLYAAPAIKDMTGLISLKKKKKIIDNSNFTKASSLSGHNHNTYVESGIKAVACSEPKEIYRFNLAEQLRNIETGHNQNNIYFINDTAQVISGILMEDENYSLLFKMLMEQYSSLENYRLVHSYLAMQAFREITGMQWLINTQL